MHICSGLSELTLPNNERLNKVLQKYRDTWKKTESVFAVPLRKVHIELVRVKTSEQSTHKTRFILEDSLTRY